MLNAKRTLVAAFIPVAAMLTGCASISSVSPSAGMSADEYGRAASKIAASNLVKAGTESGNTNLTVFGISALRKMDEKFDAAATELVTSSMPTKVNCPISTVKSENGRKIYESSNCVKAPVPAAPSASAPASSPTP